MNLGQFERQLGVLQRQVAALWSSAAREGAVLPPSIVDSFAALTQALAELQAADTEIRQQSDQLAHQQDVLEAARQHWHELFDLAPDGYLVTDLRGVVVEANQSASQLFSIPQEELVGAPLAALVPRPGRRGLLGRLTRPPEWGEQQEFDLPLKRRGERSVTANVTMARIAGLDPNQAQLAWLLRDVTDRRATEDAVRQDRDDLEGRVRERTADLEVSREQAQALARRLVEIQEAERKAIARELHDEAGQALTALIIGLGAIQKESDKPALVAAEAAELRKLADSTMEGLHRLAMRLRPASLDAVGLAAALAQHVETFRQQNDLDTELVLVGLAGERLPSEVEITVYRVVQEALTNVARHAQARHVSVIVERHGVSVRAIVEDDGLGFDVDAALRCGRLGLLGMRERVEMLGGNLTIESAPGKGTTLFAEVPSRAPGASEVGLPPRVKISLAAIRRS